MEVSITPKRGKKSLKFRLPKNESQYIQILTEIIGRKFNYLKMSEETN